jgi:Ser/Thr protein kinase RdoA (MazF antagonist)
MMDSTRKGFFMNHDLKAVFSKFEIDGNFTNARRLGSGHINDTFAVSTETGGGLVRYVIQRINHEVFKNTVTLMDNIRRVTEHQQTKLNGHQDATRRSLTLMPTLDGGIQYRDGDGDFWRCYRFIERAHTYDMTETPEQAFQAARAFGQFQKDLADLPGEPLHETIPDFHNTPKRLDSLLSAVEEDRCNRAVMVKKEIEFALAREAMARQLIELAASGEIPERITHNDTKLNNVMLDDETRQGICVIDLDTVMPGLVLYDFGDLVRSCTNPASEDERDLSKVSMQMPVYEALVKGYLSSAGEFLTFAEKSHLATGGKLITFETGLRFLTDYLEGDVYFKTHRQGHNLDRCRTQFKLVTSIEEQEEAMQRVSSG